MLFARLLFAVALLSCSFSGALGRDYQTLSDQDFQPMGTVEEFLVQTKQANDRAPHEPPFPDHFLAQQRFARGRTSLQVHHSESSYLNQINKGEPKIGALSSDGSHGSAADSTGSDSSAVDIPLQEGEEEPQYEWGRRANHQIQHMLVFHLSDPSQTGLTDESDVGRTTKLGRVAEGEERVLSFLENIGAQVFKKDFGAIYATAPIGVWERALNTQFFELRTNVGVQRFLHRPKAYSLPKDIAVYVDKVSRTVDVPVRSSPDDPSNHPGSPQVHRLARREQSRLKRSKKV